MAAPVLQIATKTASLHIISPCVTFAGPAFKLQTQIAITGEVLSVYNLTTKVFAISATGALSIPSLTVAGSITCATITASGTNPIILSHASLADIHLSGGGGFRIVNQAYTTALLSLTQAGALTTAAGVTCAGLIVSVPALTYAEAILRRTSSGQYSAVRFEDASNTKYNWLVGTQNYVNDGFEVSRSSVVGSTTYSSVMLKIDGPTGAVECAGSFTSLAGITCTTLTASGNVTAINGLIRATGTTNTANIGFITTGGAFYVGVDSSTGGNFGGSNYGAVLYNGAATPITLFTNGVNRLSIDGSTGAATFTAGITCMTLTMSGGALDYGQASGTAGTPAESRLIAAAPNLAGLYAAGVYTVNSFNSNLNNWLRFKVSNLGAALTALTLASDGAATFAAGITCTTLTASSGVRSTGPNITSGASQSVMAQADAGRTVINSWGPNDSTLGQIDFQLVSSAASISTFPLKLLPAVPGIPGATEVLIGAGQIKAGAGIACATLQSGAGIIVNGASAIGGASRFGVVQASANLSRILAYGQDTTTTGSLDIYLTSSNESAGGVALALTNTTPGTPGASEVLIGAGQIKSGGIIFGGNTVVAQGGSTPGAGYQLNSCTMGWDTASKKGWIQPGGTAAPSNLLLCTVGGTVECGGDISQVGGAYHYLRGDATTDGSVRISSQAAGTFSVESRTSGTWNVIGSFI